MEDSQFKPKVFLSHAKSDESFVKRIYSGLSKCQCLPWLDTEEIRDGKSWLDVIFQEGIPACDVLLVYLTENSVNSKMVTKELNAAFVEQLRNNNIRILPYVSEANLRSKLRPDIASLQCREWNSKNFSRIFPSVVAEIWRSNLEKKIKDAILREKGIRLELEHKITTLEKMSEDQIFSKSENAEFNYLAKEIDYSIIIPATVKYDNGSEKAGKVDISLLNYLAKIADDGYDSFRTMIFLHDIRIFIEKELKLKSVKSVAFDGRREISELHRVASKYGLIENHLVQNHGGSEYVHQITPKYRRFVYWLEYNKRTAKAFVKIITN